MDCTRIQFSRHAVQRMFERAIQADAASQMVRDGEIIEDYPDDTPWPSALLLGRSGSTPIHLVVARNVADQTCIVITVYVPDPSRWEDDSRKRKTQ